MKHEKHPKLQRPDLGFFGRNEIAFLGTSCEQINAFFKEIITYLGSNKNICIIDADHKNVDSEFTVNTFQDKISYKQFSQKKVSEIGQKILLNEQDLILVNGNHFEAKSQIVFLNPAKEASLNKRLGQLSNVLAFISTDAQLEPYNWLPETNVPVISMHDMEQVANIIQKQIKTPVLKALILKGGKSSRMGEDKSNIHYFGKSQVLHLQNIFEKAGIETFLSEKYENNISTRTIIDAFHDLGPYGGILSAFKQDPNAAWLVIACDMPLIHQKEIDFLISHRNPLKVATACYNPETEFPDPLFTIWEPKAYLILLQYLAMGYSCPRKVLINEDIEMIHLPNPQVLANVNTPQEKEEIIKMIKLK